MANITKLKYILYSFYSLISNIFSITGGGWMVEERRSNDNDTGNVDCECKSERWREIYTLMMSLVLLGCLNTSLAQEKNDDSPRFHYYRIRKSLLHTIYNLLFVFQVMPPSTLLGALGVSLSVLFTQLMSFKVSQIFSPVVDTVVRKLLSSRVHRLECASPSTFLHRTLFSSIKHSLGAAAAVSTNDSP